MRSLCLCVLEEEGKEREEEEGNEGEEEVAVMRDSSHSKLNPSFSLLHQPPPHHTPRPPCVLGMLGVLTLQGFVSVPFQKKKKKYRAYYQSLAKDSACNFVNNVKCQRLNKLGSKLQRRSPLFVCSCTNRKRSTGGDEGDGIGIDRINKHIKSPH